MRVVKLSDLMEMELKTMSEKLERVSQIDSLTELYNKQYFNEACIREWRNAARLKQSLALIMIEGRNCIREYKTSQNTDIEEK